MITGVESYIPVSQGRGMSLRQFLNNFYDIILAITVAAVCRFHGCSDFKLSTRLLNCKVTQSILTLVPGAGLLSVSDDDLCKCTCFPCLLCFVRRVKCGTIHG